MNPWDGLGKLLLGLGLLLVVLGVSILLIPKIPWLGRLPGDIFIKGDKVSFYFPITTGIIISLLLTLLFALFRK